MENENGNSVFSDSESTGDCFYVKTIASLNEFILLKQIPPTTRREI